MAFCIWHICIFYADAVYSKELTGSSDSNEAGSQYIQHLPFFVLVHCLLESRDEKREEVEEKMEQVEKEWVYFEINFMQKIL